MRNSFTILLFLVSPILQAQTTLIVDNNFNAPTGAHIYSTLQAASNAANSGDTIQVQPSPITYGNISINKPVYLVGIGFNVVKDIAFESRIGTITLTNKDDLTTLSSGTVITGLRLSNIFLGVKTGAGSWSLQNITISNCIINALYSSSSYVNIDGLEVYDCYVYGTYGSGSLYFDRPVTNSLFRNNLVINHINLSSATPGSNTITNNILYGRIRVVAEGTNTIISNNVFVGATSISYAFEGYLRDCLVSYNIFYGVTPSVAAAGSTSLNFGRNTFSFNILHASGSDVWPPTGGAGNNTGSANYIASPLFTSVSLLSTWSSAYDFTLLAGSPALLANIPDGGAVWDIGLTGGGYPWTESNIVFQPTALPVIEVLNTSTIINPGNNLPVHIKATSH